MPITQPTLDVLVVGGHIGYDLMIAEHLSRRGLTVGVARSTRLDEASLPVPSAHFRAFSRERVLRFETPAALVRLARKARLVVSISGTFGFVLKWRWVLRRALRLPPVINIATGSDFSELLDEAGRRAMFFRYFVRTCDYNVVAPYPAIIGNVLKHRIRNSLFLRYSYYLPPARRPEPRSDRLRYFHPSSLDFKVNDPGEHRNSSKGNDRFLRGFIRALKAGLDAECVILDRGPDRVEARRIIASSGLEERFTWRAQLSREEMVDEFAAADVVVDQFDVGGLGGIAVEGMAMARPVLVYLQPRCLDVLYTAHPPVLNAYTEDEIYARVLANRDRSALVALGLRAKAWVEEHHAWDAGMDQLLLYYTMLTGRGVVDYRPGPLATEPVVNGPPLC